MTHQVIEVQSKWNYNSPKSLFLAALALSPMCQFCSNVLLALKKLTLFGNIVLPKY
jgi:hypothetical protein